jgi:hypothetical protein
LVVERPGTIQLVQGGAASTFLDIRNLVSVGNERGFLSVAVSPDYGSSGHIYVAYTNTDGHLEVDEFTASGAAAPVSSRRPVLIVPHPPVPMHYGGQLQFGPDGYLYVSTGDGGTGGDSAQNVNDLLGKILRIDPRQSGGASFTVPPGNPFGNAVWSLGLRNPWRFSFDAVTGDLLIGDVGEETREEIDFAPSSSGPGRGMNFGWPCREGSEPYSGCGGAFTDPILEYPRTGPDCNAVAGGYVVRDSSVPDLNGRYVYGDHCVGQVRSLVPGLPAAMDDRSEGLRVQALSGFGQDSCRRVYAVSLVGPVSRLVGPTPADCSAISPPGATPRRTCAGHAATRIAAADGSVVGTPDRDVIVGDKHRNRIRAKGGNDVICAGGGRDRIKAGPGRDIIRGGRGNDRCVGGPGKDRERSC